MSDKTHSLAVDVMGADGGIGTIIQGCLIAARRGLKARLVLFGREDEIRHEIGRAGLYFPDGKCEIRHADDIVTMDDKPARMLRRGRETSMWTAIAALKAGEVSGVISSGNTGALMAMARLQLRMIDGVDRPAITALWPNAKGGKSVFLDVGANVDVNAKQLVQFAIMGEAYFRALTGKEKPTVGLLNVGAEEAKGHELIKTAFVTLREADPEMAFKGFVEGDDLAKGSVDVVVTDGFTGNIALKSAEGTARMVGGWVKDALTSSLLSKIGAALMINSLRKLKTEMDPSYVNGAPLLGLNGLVVKSHGSANAEGVAAAVAMADNLAHQPFQDAIKETIAKVDRRAKEMSKQTVDIKPDTSKEKAKI